MGEGQGKILQFTVYMIYPFPTNSKIKKKKKKEKQTQDGLEKLNFLIHI